MFYILNQRGIIKKNNVELCFLYIALHVIERNMYTCIKFGVIWTKLHSGQEMLYKNQSKGNIKKMEQGRIVFHCTLSHCINMHTKFEVIWTYGHKVML